MVVGQHHVGDLAWVPPERGDLCDEGFRRVQQRVDLRDPVVPQALPGVLDIPDADPGIDGEE